MLQGRNERAVRDSMDFDKTVGATDCQHGSRANRDRRARGDKAPTTGGKASHEQTASKEDVETKRLLEEFRALVTPTLWERVQTAARAYYSKIFKVERATCACNAQELQKNLERLEKKVDRIAETKSASANKTRAEVARTGAGSAAPAPEQRVQRVPKKFFRELIVDTRAAGPDITE